jgi:hypothetical protein
LSPERWEQVKDAQRSTVAAQMLLNPVAGNEAIFQASWFKSYDVRPTILNVYITCDPSMGRAHSSDRTAIAVIGVDLADNRYLLDGVRHRMPLSERYSHLQRFHKRWELLYPFRARSAFCDNDEVGIEEKHDRGERDHVVRHGGL